MSTVHRHDETQVMTRPTTTRPVRDLGPVVAGVGATTGVLFLVVGLVLLARAGVPADGSLLDAIAAVGPFSGNPLLAVLAILAGAGYLATGVRRDATAMFGMGLVAGVFGLVWMIEPNAFGDVLGTTRATAFLVTIVGVVTGALGGYASNRLFSTA